MSGAGFNRNNDVHISEAWPFYSGPSSMIIGTYSSSEWGALVLYDETNCAGQSGRFMGPAPGSTEKATWYTEDQMEYTYNIWDLYIHGATVPYGYTAYLYPDNGWSGTPYIIKGQLPGEHDEPACVNLTGIPVYSIKVERDADIPPA